MRDSFDVYPFTTIHVTGAGRLPLSTGGNLDNFHAEPRRYAYDLEGALCGWDPFTWGAGDGDRCTPLLSLERAAWLLAHQEAA